MFQVSVGAGVSVSIGSSVWVCGSLWVGLGVCVCHAYIALGLSEIIDEADRHRCDKIHAQGYVCQFLHLEGEKGEWVVRTGKVDKGIFKLPKAKQKNWNFSPH